MGNGFFSNNTQPKEYETVRVKEGIEQTEVVQNAVKVAQRIVSDMQKAGNYPEIEHKLREPKEDGRTTFTAPARIEVSSYISSKNGQEIGQLTVKDGVQRAIANVTKAGNLSFPKVEAYSMRDKKFYEPKNMSPAIEAFKKAFEDRVVPEKVYNLRNELTAELVDKGDLVHYVSSPHANINPKNGEVDYRISVTNKETNESVQVAVDKDGNGKYMTHFDKEGTATFIGRDTEKLNELLADKEILEIVAGDGREHAAPTQD